MSLSDYINRIWSNSPYKPPKVPLIYYQDEYMVTVDDSEMFLRFMSYDGQIFLALNKYCQLGEGDDSMGKNVYVCSKVDPILCSPGKGPESMKDIFVLNNIASLLA